MTKCKTKDLCVSVKDTQSNASKKLIYSTRSPDAFYIANDSFQLIVWDKGSTPKFSFILWLPCKKDRMHNCGCVTGGTECVLYR